MIKAQQPELSRFAELYELLIPKDHLLKKIDALLDFSFICDLVRDSYNQHYGRPAVHPERVMRLLFLQFLYGLSDEQVIQDAQVNLAYKWFLGITPEGTLPDASVLSRFRTLRLAPSEQTIDALLDAMVKQCVEKGLVKSKRALVDATHVVADTRVRSPIETIRSAAKKIMRAMGKHYPGIASELPAMPDTLDVEIPLAIKVLLEYLETLVKKSEEQMAIRKGPVGDALKRAKKILSDENRGMFNGPCSAEDVDARRGYKSRDAMYFGYKDHITMLDGDEIITACQLTAGNGQEGPQLEGLLEQSQHNVGEITEVVGDAAYSSRPNLKMLAEKQIEAYVPISVMLKAEVDPRFTYNKDSDQWICLAGHTSCGKRRHKVDNRHGSILSGYTYYWEARSCMECSMKQECRRSPNGKKGRELMITERSEEQLAALERERDPAKDEIRQRRKTIEHKCAELKRFLGLARARYRTRILVKLQAVLTAFVANAKRMVKLAEMAAA